MSETPLKRIPFTPQTEASIRALCNWMQIAAVVSILAAVAKFVGAFTPRLDIGNLIDGIVTLLLAVWIYQAGTAFRQVANTDVADQRYLMEGFGHLRRVFLVQSILVIVTLVLLLVGLIVVALVMAAKVSSTS
jgi:hypothetical protein